MRVSDLFDQPHAAIPDGSDGDYFVSGYRGVSAWEESDEYRAWAARVNAPFKENGGPHCFGCYAKVDHHPTGNGMAPIEVRNRGTNDRHFCKEMAASRARRR